jgi:hypothetical protein
VLALQFVDCQNNLPNLICLGFAFVVLDVDPGIADPGRFENRMAGSRLARLPEIFLTHFLEIAKADICRFALHLIENFSGIRHVRMVSIVEPLLKRA